MRPSPTVRGPRPTRGDLQVAPEAGAGAIGNQDVEHFGQRLLRTAAIRAADAPWNTIGAAFGHSAPAEYASCRRHRGYERSGE